MNECAKIAKARRVLTGNADPIYLTVNGRSLTVAQWAKIANQHPKTIYRRIKAGWTDEECVYGQQHRKRTDPKVKLTFAGETYTLQEWARLLGVARDSLYSRWRRGLPPYKVLAGSRQPALIAYKGETKTMYAWAQHFKVPYISLYSRIRSGARPEILFAEYERRLSKRSV